MNKAKLHVCVCLSSYSGVSYVQYDWAKSIDGDDKEALPHDAPVPLGKPIVMTHYFDTNLYRDILTGRSVTEILHLINKVPLTGFQINKLLLRPHHMVLNLW